MDDIVKYNEEVLRVLRERENLFKDYSLLCKMTPTEHWVLYTIYSGYLRNIYYKQKDLATLWSFPKQTINSSVQKLKANNLVRLTDVENNKKEKYIELTEEGIILSERIMKPLIDIELDAFNKFTEEERSTLFYLLDKWNNHLKVGIYQLSEKISKEDF